MGIEPVGTECLLLNEAVKTIFYNLVLIFIKMNIIIVLFCVWDKKYIFLAAFRVWPWWRLLFLFCNSSDICASAPTPPTLCDSLRNSDSPALFVIEYSEFLRKILFLLSAVTMAAFSFLGTANKRFSGPPIHFKIWILMCHLSSLTHLSFHNLKKVIHFLNETAVGLKQRP